METLLGLNGGNYMMIDMNEKLEKVMNETTDIEKIRLFYELAKYIVNNTEAEDDDMENLLDDIANVVNDIENL